MDAADSQRTKPRQSSPVVLYNLLPVCFRGASVTSEAVFLFLPSFAKTLVSLDFFHTRASQKELAYAFGGQHSIQLSYGCQSEPVARIRRFDPKRVRTMGFISDAGQRFNRQVADAAGVRSFLPLRDKRAARPGSGR
jgi:hypothetical protein